MKSASDTKLELSGTIGLPIHMHNSRSPVSFCVVNELVVSIIIEKMYMDRILR